MSAAEPDLRTDAVRGIAWIGLERWLARLLGLGTFVILGRLLAPQAFGLVALATSCIAGLQILTDFGFSAWVVQADDLSESDTSTAFWTSLAIGLAMALSMFSCAGIVAAWFDEPALANILRALSSVLVLTGLSSTPSALLTRELRFRELAVRQTTAVAVAAVVGVAMALADAGEWALVGQAVVHQATACVMLFKVTAWRPSLDWSLSTAREIFAYGFGIVTITGLQQLQGQVENFLIGAMLGTRALGYWSVASRLLTVLYDVCTNIIATVSGPTFLRIRSDLPRLVSAYATSVASSSFLVAPALISFAIMGPRIIALTFGAQWSGSGPLAAALAIGGVASSLSFFDRGIFIAADRLRVEAELTLAIFVANTIAVAVGSRLGLLTTAVGVAILAYVIWPVRRMALRKYCAIPIRAQLNAIRVVLAAALAGVMTSALIAALQPSDTTANLLGLLAFFAMTYLMAALALARPVVLGVLFDIARLRRSKADGQTRMVSHAKPSCHSQR